MVEWLDRKKIILKKNKILSDNKVTIVLMFLLLLFFFYNPTDEACTSIDQFPHVDIDQQECILFVCNARQGSPVRDDGIT